VTADGITYPLPQPFHVMAREPDWSMKAPFPARAQLDRLLLKLAVAIRRRPTKTR